MKTNLIKIGNSKGIRINSNIIKECELSSEVEINVVDKKIIIEAVKEPRANWNKGFKKMHKNKEDVLLISDNNAFDKDWEW
ncbi:MAG: AbrB/MazE/SpoVT family DNA-binding domain-containing protein [Actinomycetota bacterium]|nr:AbrB/MazE/SpoVT family DNA-binding domain-containing protein [Actinomycetota bacterium]